MDLTPHLEALRADLAAAAAVGGPDAARAAELLSGAVEPALRLLLVDLLTDAAAELAPQLAGTPVEVRMRGRDPELVVSAPLPAPAPEPAGEDEGTARLTLRLPEGLKARAEAAASADGISVNAWLVRAVSSAVEPGAFRFAFATAPGPGPRRLSGYGRA